MDPLIWKACAGGSARFPPVGARVYYFPQGHAEQASAPPDFGPHHLRRPLVLACVLSIQLLADPDTDEVFARLRLQPLPDSSAADTAVGADSEEDGGDGGELMAFTKRLTPSDANNGGGFSVPRFCADAIFPRLDYAAEPPVQMILVRDVHGGVWQFRHIFRGTPRRHLLTTGWSKFVNSKKLVAGDSVVFVRGVGGEIFVGVRRASRLGGGAGFWRSSRGRVPAESVVEAAELAAAGRAFEVVYHPNERWPEFVVLASAVEEAVNVCWAVGSRVKMAVDKDDPARVTYFHGSVQAISGREVGTWTNSPWRMLQVNWDEPEVLQHLHHVSPWQVELASAPLHMQTAFPVTKKMRLQLGMNLLPDENTPMFFDKTNLANSTMGQLNPSFLNHNIFPAGMQGARHNLFCVSYLPSFEPSIYQLLDAANIHSKNLSSKLSGVSTELHIGSISPSINSSLQSKESSTCFPLAGVLGHQRISTVKSEGGSFQLFGKIIEMNMDKTYKDDVGDGKGCKDTESSGKMICSSISNFPCVQFYNQLSSS